MIIMQYIIDTCIILSSFYLTWYTCILFSMHDYIFVLIVNCLFLFTVNSKIILLIFLYECIILNICESQYHVTRWISIVKWTINMNLMNLMKNDSISGNRYMDWELKHETKCPRSRQPVSLTNPHKISEGRAPSYSWVVNSLGFSMFLINYVHNYINVIVLF